MPKRLHCLLFLAFGSVALAQDAQPVDSRTLLGKLKEIQEKHDTASKALFSKVLQDFTTAAGSNTSAIRFYEAAIYNTMFVGQNREQTQFQEWKKKEADKLKSDEMQTAARLHLKYLALTMQRANGMKTPQLIPLLINYTNEVVGAGDLTNQELMKKGVTDSLFVRWYGIGKMFNNLKEWEASPGNVDGIYQKTILPQFRRDKDPRILSYWDGKIEREAQHANSSKAAFNTDRFNGVKKPSLYWSRAQDELAIGQRNRAINDMFSLIKNYPDHPDIAEWIKSLQEILTPAPVETPAVPAASPGQASPAPAPAAADTAAP